AGTQSFSDTNLQITPINNSSRASNPNPDRKHEHSTHHHLKRRRQQRSIHIPSPNQRNRGKLHGHNDYRRAKRHMEIFNQERERMPNPPRRSHQSSHRTPQHWTPAPGHRSVI